LSPTTPNTDGIYSAAHTYQDNVPPAKMAEVCMTNYDASFGALAHGVDMLVVDFTFGCGSSREQDCYPSVQDLARRGRQLQQHLQPGINKALMGVEMPRLVATLWEAFGGEKVPTRRTGWRFVWHLRRSRVTVTEDGPKQLEPEGGRAAASCAGYYGQRRAGEVG